MLLSIILLGAEIIIVIVMVAVFMKFLSKIMAKNMEMMQIFLRYVLLLDGYKLFDMICLDWWLITKSGIYQRLYPETIGCKSYEKMGYNTKSQVIKLVLFTAAAFFIALIINML